jgi:hypothetical protein
MITSHVPAVRLSPDHAGGLLLRLSRREEAWKATEILILRHQVAVLQRQPHPGDVRLAGHMGVRAQRRQALPSIRPDGVTLKGVGSLRSPLIAPLYRWTGEPRCIAAYREPRVFPSAEASTCC